MEKVEAAAGTRENPVSDAELLEKFHDLAAPVLPRQQADRLAEHVWMVETLAEISPLVALAAGRTS
jgi:2-methylcitrate dehydratase PrpD